MSDISSNTDSKNNNTSKLGIIRSLTTLAFDVTSVTTKFVLNKMIHPFKSCNDEEKDKNSYLSLHKKQQANFDHNGFGPGNLTINYFDKNAILNSNPNKIMYTPRIVDEFNKKRRLNLGRSKSMRLDQLGKNNLLLDDINPHYKVETHKVITKDGFVLTIFRINVDEDSSLNKNIDDEEDYFNKNYEMKKIYNNENKLNLSFNCGDINNKVIEEVSEEFEANINNYQDKDVNNDNNNNNNEMSLKLSNDNNNKLNDIDIKVKDILTANNNNNNNNNINKNYNENLIKDINSSTNLSSRNTLMNALGLDKESSSISDNFNEYNNNSNNANILSKFYPLNRIIKKQPVLIQHGIIDSSDGYLCNKEEKCLPLVLANKGYDVWLANSRGNYYSDEHLYLSYSTNGREYYDYTLEELGRLDIPAMLKHIQDTRNDYNKKIILIGHSQGAAASFAGMSINNAFYNQYVKLFIALAPVCKMTGLTSSILKISTYTEIERMCWAAGMYSLGHRSEGLSYLSTKHLDNFNFVKEEQDIARKNKEIIRNKLGESLSYNRNNSFSTDDSETIEEKKSKWQNFKNFFNIKNKIANILGIDCSSFMCGYLTDKGSQEINDSNALNKLISYNPSGVSVKAFIHFKKNMNADAFRRYDYGKDENIRRYNQSYPPEYDLQDITVPTVIFYGLKDRLVNHDDIEYVQAKMINTIIDVKAYPKLGHLSFQVGKDASFIEDLLHYTDEYKEKE